MADARVNFILSASDRTKSAFASVRKAIGGISRIASGAALAVGGIAGIGGGAALANMGRQSINTADQIGHLQNRLGGTAQFWSGMGHAAELSGVSVQTFTMAMQRMTRRIGEASRGTGEAKDQIAAFGLDAGKLSKLPLERQFFIIADKLAAIKNPGLRAAAAMKLFDSEGVALIQMMTDGSAGLQKMMQDAISLGVVMNNVDILNAQGFKGALTRMGAAFQGFANDIILPALPMMTDAVQSLTDYVLINKSAWMQWGNTAIDIFGQVLNFISPVFEVMGRGLGMAVDGWQMLAQVAGTAWEIIKEIFSGAGEVIGGVAAGIAQLAQGNFSGFSAINDQLSSSAAARGERLGGLFGQLGNDALNATSGGGFGGGGVSAASAQAQLARALGSNEEATALLRELVDISRKRAVPGVDAIPILAQR